MPKCCWGRVVSRWREPRREGPSEAVVETGNGHCLVGHKLRPSGGCASQESSSKNFSAASYSDRSRTGDRSSQESGNDIAHTCALSVCIHHKGLQVFLGDWVVSLIRASC